LLLALPLAALPACQRDETVTSYDVPHPEREKIQLLAAILPHGDATYFVRLSGPEAAVAEQKPAFDAFVKSLRFNDSAKPPIQWTAPDVWTEQGGDVTRGGVAFRTKGEPPLQAKLSSLGKFGAGENTLTGNVNRWRKQLSLPPATDEQIDELIKAKGENAAFVVDIKGTGVGHAPAMPPMGHPPMGEHPPIAAGAGKSVPFKYEAPRGWEPSGAGAVSRFGYTITDGSARANVTVSPLQGIAGGILSNLKRWRQDRGQADLPPIPDAEILKQAQTIPVAGIQSTYADFSGKNLRILGVIVPMRDATWFIKMTGPPDLVGRQKANFEAFVKSFRLDTE
jgi:hypothetical protein